MLKLKCHIQCSGPQPARPQLEVFVLAVKGVPSFSSSSLFCFYLLLVGWTNERDFRKEPKPFDFTAAIAVLLWASTTAKCWYPHAVPLWGRWVGPFGSIARGIFSAEFPDLGPEREGKARAFKTNRYCTPPKIRVFCPCGSVVLQAGCVLESPGKPLKDC